ncbi:hypothetical protein ACIFOC_00377 [Leucobacter aridicollis]|uniref:hypothetical protein n=1 Tax=Leucobacter aridicollis TaxID=283878 RepID=UPI0037C9B669
MYDPKYDPVEHLDALKVRLVKHTLHHEYAIWAPERRLVAIDRNTPAHLVRPVLSHEADHAEKNDVGGHHSKNETRANLNSALRLINPSEWDLLAATLTDYDRICLELGITRAQFRAYHEHRRSIDAARVRLDRIGDALYLNPKMGVGQWAMRFEVA